MSHFKQLNRRCGIEQKMRVPPHHIDDIPNIDLDGCCIGGRQLPAFAYFHANRVYQCRRGNAESAEEMP
jgi:hypothetical protein